MLNLTRNPLPTYLPTPANKPVQATPHQRVGSQEQLLEDFLKTHPSAKTVGSQLRYLLGTLPQTFPLLHTLQGQTSRLRTTLKKTPNALQVISELGPLARFFRVEDQSYLYPNRSPNYYKQAFKDRHNELIRTLQANLKIKDLETRLKEEFPGISMPKPTWVCQDTYAPVNLDFPNSYPSTFRVLKKVELLTNLPDELPESHPRLLGLHAQLIQLFSEKLGVNRKSL